MRSRVRRVESGFGGDQGPTVPETQVWVGRQVLSHRQDGVDAGVVL